MPVIVTRPQDEALRWVQRLRAQGVDALALPLIEIAPALDPRPVREAWQRLGAYAAAMFVSGNAVRHFFALGTPGLPFGARAWAPGPATADALRECGVAQARIDQPPRDARQFDSESLWHEVGQQVREGSRVLIVRGSDGEGQSAGREWLAQQVAGRRGSVDTVVAYRRTCPHWDAASLAAGRSAARDGSCWLFSSSEAVANLGELLPGESWVAAHALATHPRIEQAARAAGFGDVRASRPAFEEVLASLQSAR